ncbi:hypothetical protein ACJ41O_008165 [Fusarium nematophilum]
MSVKENKADEKTPSKKLSLVDQPTLVTLKNRDDSDSNRAWAQDAIRDITNKGNEVKGACASTPTTTTTGCVPTMSTSHRKPVQGPRAQPLQRRQLSRVIYNMRTLGATPDSLGSCRENHGPSTSPKPVLAAEIQATDTTSMKLQEFTGERLEMGVPNDIPALKLGVAVTRLARRSSSTSTSTIGFGGLEKKADRALLCDGKPHESPEFPLEKTLGHQTELHEQMMDLRVHVPGGFPAQVNAEDGIADLSSKRFVGNETGGLWDAVREMLRTVKDCAVWLMRLYWEMVQPVFDSKSEYWERAGPQENDWKHLASLCLAVPLIIGLLMGLMWAMELTVTLRRCMGSMGGMDDGLACVAEEVVLMLGRTITGG